MNRKAFRVEKLEHVDKIPDLPTAIRVMDELQIPRGKWFNLQEGKRLISEYFLQNEKRVNSFYQWKDQNAIADAMKEDKENRVELINLFEKSGAFFKELPSRFGNDLERVFPDFLVTLKNKSQQLNKSDCAIVVAGDTGAGKSTLINLLVGQRILPTNALQCTATVCELRKSTMRAIVLHHRDGTQKTTLECPDDSQVPGFTDSLAKHVTETDPNTDDSPYTKVEIHWPFHLMEEGVVFVDTPGIGGSHSLDMGQYMDKALGFIYVINTGDAGGIHRDRLGSLLLQGVQHSDFDPATAVFVCNKWDQVDQREEAQVQHYVKEKLGKSIPTINDSQIYKISATQALDKLDYRNMLKGHVELVEGIRQVLPTTFHSKLSAFYRWLSTILKRTLYSLKVSKQLDARSVEEKETMYRSVCAQIEQLETRAESRIKDMRRDVRNAVEDITESVIKLLNTNNRRDLVVWNSDLCPRPDNWRKVAAEASTRISSRVQDIVDKWDRSRNVVDNVRTSIIKKFKQDVELFEDQAKQIEGVFLGEDVKTMVDLHNSLRTRAPITKVWKKADKKTGGKTEGFMSLGTAVGSSFSLDTRANKVRALFKTYSSSNAPQVMQDASKMFLDGLTEKNVTSAVEKFFERFAKNIDRIGKMLPEFLRADRQLMTSLTREVDHGQANLMNMYPKFIEEAEDLQGYLDMFFARKLMKFNYGFAELNKNATEIPIGRGSFANVYYSRLVTADGDIPVALKVCKEPLDITNVTDVLLEDNTLRDLKHRNVVTYYGASRQVSGREMKWVMVLEYCPKTLMAKFVGKEARSPSKYEADTEAQIEAMKTVAVFAEQILCGLEYLHKKGLVHRDMKPDNILLDADDVVKLTDVGLAKRVHDISGTIAGSPVYMAPEVLLQKGRYDVKADMYSFGIITWEMWYGQDAANHIKGQLFTTFERAIEKGLRPSMSINCKPPEQWHILIVKCWNIDPEVRLSSSQARQFFQKFLEHYK
ncbi:dual serine/threonine and tyrosine protein kinase-like [Haliotis rubra]|uniref:dual serine/threonine and tyrosine protein kinase-like n=1 Tax=Haliotis rubra TaxID=36100 RepID=UPI001EE62859|nr:dual serine/threonine and tyrosine protein kinase-like [Haliotis rubra]